MKKEDWDKVKEKLMHSFGTAKLEIDGYKVTILRERYTETKDCFSVYVNGKQSLKDYMNDTEIRQRFGRRTVKKLPMQKGFLKTLSERERKAFDKRRTYEANTPWWLSFDNMRRHFNKNNKNIKIAESADESI